MSGKPAKLTSLEARKQLLLVESELNRAQLIHEVGELKNTFRQIKNEVHSIGVMATSAAKLATTFFAVRHLFSRREKGGSGKSWMAALLKGAELCASFLGNRSR